MAGGWAWLFWCDAQVRCGAQPGATILRFKNPLFWCGRPSGSGGRHVKGEHVKDVAQDGSVMVLILPMVIFRRHYFKAHDGRAWLSPAPYLSAAPQEPSPTSGHLTTR